jgi:hypothetical protein
MTFKEYMNQTEFAAKQLFNSLDYYHKLLSDARPPVFSTVGCTKEKFMQELDEWGKVTKKEHDHFSATVEQYMGLKYSHATISGSILQLAHMAISKFSDYEGDCKCLTKKYKKFCIGRKIRSVPLGAIIYAARNQYNHWDDEIFSDATKCIFNMIATCEEATDLSFDLDRRHLDIYSDKALGLLGWKTYTNYRNDMYRMFGDPDQMEEI